MWEKLGKDNFVKGGYINVTTHAARYCYLNGGNKKVQDILRTLWANFLRFFLLNYILGIYWGGAISIKWS